MIVYEVNLYVRREIEDEFRTWLDAHVREIVALPGFSGARLAERLEPAAGEGDCVLCTQYFLDDAEALARYLREFAPALRADGVNRFGDRFRAERRVLQGLSDY